VRAPGEDAGQGERHGGGDARRRGTAQGASDGVAASRAAARLSSILRREAHPTRERVASPATVEEDPADGVGVGLELERQPDAGGLDHGSTVWQDARRIASAAAC
jgi:hypothetical protein